MINLFQEIAASMRRNKMRTFLTGFSIAWGIFMLIVLLGAGNGLSNAFNANWGDRMVNVVQIWGGRTNLPYAGFSSGRRIDLQNKDIEFPATEFPDEVNFSVGTVNAGSKTVSFGVEYLTSSVTGVYPSHLPIEGAVVSEGRFINELDIHEKRKNTVISEYTKNILFKNTQAIGKTVNIDGINYTVVGVYYIKNSQNASRSYIPFSTAQVVYNRGLGVSNLAFTLSDRIDSKEASEDFMKRYRKGFAAMHQMDPKDDNALWYWNRFEDYLQTATVGRYMNIAVWIIGIFTLISGIVGVSNIMLITVRERTREFGVRKAIGASPANILALVVVESICITAAFGYIGLVCGVGITEAMATVFNGEGGGERGSFSIFVNPTVDMNIAIQATVLLIVAGTLAGFFPALKAVRIKTIEALNTR